MSPGLRVALLSDPFADAPGSPSGRAARELAGGLAELGHRPAVLTHDRSHGRRSAEGGVDLIRIRRLPEAPLRARGFVGSAAQLPLTVASLLAGRFDLAHAFTVVDARAALLWAGLRPRPVVFTCTDPPRREDLADRRGRLSFTIGAYRDTDAATAVNEDVRAAIEHWLALDLPVLDPGDAGAYADLYRRLVSSAGPRRAQT